MVPRVGLRLKFLSHFKQYKSEDVSETVGDALLDESCDSLSVTIGSTSSESSVSQIEEVSEVSEPPLKKTRGQQEFNLQEVILKTPNGEEIVEGLRRDDGLLELKQRRELTRILVSHLITVYGDRPSTAQKMALAKALITEFPSQKDSEGEGYEAWFTRGRRTNPSSGYLEQRLRNVRKRSGKTLKHKAPALKLERRTLPEPTVSEERALQMQTWLKHNLHPQAQVENYMKETIHFRTEWVKKNPSLTIQEIAAEYPRLLDRPGMIEQDFTGNYGEVADRLLFKWESKVDQLIRYAEKQGSAWKQHLSIVSSLDDAHKSSVALQVLPCILPTGQVKNRNGKTTRASTSEALAAFIDCEPVGTNLPEYLSRVQAERKKPQPFILILGTRVLPSQIFLVIEGVAIEHPTLLKTVDACFKAFYVFDIIYPPQCQSTWEFIPKYFFGMEDGKGKSLTTAAVRSLRTYLEKE
ncbi:hypothetical protein HOLleu_44066 [Holothuria leucospilota]|uniref:Uncharacterized protein n=1 Tax=Holothuria leucospilota TaxID=206669 RepID=A0A9Q0YB92_HOLLE|nr:hypothetical protein HOLleu_44066 [Holothuria leucospilota]